MNRVDLPRTKRSMACNFARKKLWFEVFEERILLDAELGSLMGDSLVVPDSDETVPSAGIHSQWLYDAQGHSLKNLALRSKSDSGTSSEDGLTRIVSENGPAEKWKPSSDTVPHAGLSTHVGSVSMVWGGTDRQVMPGSWVAHVSNRMGSMSDEAEFVVVADLSRTMLRLTSQIGNGDWLQVEAPAYYTAEMVRSELGRRAMVLSVQPVFADYSESTIPNDPYFPGQKNLLERMDVTEAWGATGSERGTTSVVVAVNDTAVDYTHPDLYRNIWLNQLEIPVGLTFVDSDADGLITFWDLNAEANLGATADLNGNGYIDAGDLLFPLSEGGWADGIDGGANGFADDLIGWDFAHDDNDPYPYDEYYENAHGTHVAGAIGATGNDHFGIAGITWKTQLMVVSGLDEFGFGTDVALASAIDYAVANGARVTNASWNGPYSELIDLAVQNADTAQHLVVAAAGNDGTDNDTMPDYAYPASLPYDNVLSVTATDEFDYSYTNYGATTVDLAAAERVLSTVPLWYFGSGQWTDAYEIMFGTSMAASLVTGTAALLWSTNPSANSAEIRDAILAGVDLVPDLDLVTGTHPVATGGRLNVFGSLRQLHSMDLFVQATSPSEGETVFGSQPTVYSVTFNSPVQLSLDPSDLQASDFTVNAIPATGVSLSTDGLTATFTFAVPPLSNEGLITTFIAPGAVRGVDISATLTGGYEGTFRYDIVPLTVTAVDPAPGTVFEPSSDPFHFRLYFNEAFDPSSLSGIFQHPYSADRAISLRILFGVYVYRDAPLSTTPVLNNTALDLTFSSSLPFRNEGILSLIIEAETLSDLSGNDNPSFSEAKYSIDITSRPYSVPLTASSPFGSMVALGATIDGFVNPGLPTDDVDDYTLNIDAGETLTVQVFNVAATLRPEVQIYNPFNTLVASSVSVSEGSRVLLQSIPRRGAHFEHARQRHDQHRLSLRA